MQLTAHRRIIGQVTDVGGILCMLLKCFAANFLLFFTSLSKCFQWFRYTDQYVRLCWIK